MPWRITPTHHLRLMVFNHTIIRSAVIDRAIKWGDCTLDVGGYWSDLPSGPTWWGGCAERGRALPRHTIRDRMSHAITDSRHPA